jgi:hypothetical protein
MPKLSNRAHQYIALDLPNSVESIANRYCDILIIELECERYSPRGTAGCLNAAPPPPMFCMTPPPPLIQDRRAAAAAAAAATEYRREVGVPIVMY